MRLSPIASGPFLSRLWVEEDEFEEIALATLAHCGLLPAEPGPVDIELLTERLFGFPYDFADLPPGQLGRLTFGPDGPSSLTVHARLDSFTSPTLNHRCRSTLAHECGHGILHTQLYRQLWERHQRAAEKTRFSLVPPGLDLPLPGSPGQWWEYQANRIMAALLMPAPLVLEILGLELAFDVPYPRWPYFRRRQIVAELGGTFDVSQSLAQYRVEDLVRKSLTPMRAAALTGKSYAAALALCWPDTLGLANRHAA